MQFLFILYIVTIIMYCRIKVKHLSKSMTWNKIHTVLCVLMKVWLFYMYFICMPSGLRFIYEFTITAVFKDQVNSITNKKMIFSSAKWSSVCKAHPRGTDLEVIMGHCCLRKITTHSVNPITLLLPPNQWGENWFVCVWWYVGYSTP